MSLWNALMSFLGISASAGKNILPHIDTKSSVEPQIKTEEVPAVKSKKELIEAEYPLVIKPHTALSPSYYQADRGDKGVLEDFFFDYLAREFPDSANNTVAIKAEDYNLTPDLAIIDNKRKSFYCN